MGLCEVLTIVFVVLKLTGVIAWSWVAVFIPEMIAVVLYVVLITLQVIISVKSAERDVRMAFGLSHRK